MITTADAKRPDTRLLYTIPLPTHGGTDGAGGELSQCNFAAASLTLYPSLPTGTAGAVGVVAVQHSPRHP